MSQAGLGKAFWAEVLSYAVHLVNRLPISRNGEKTPLEVWLGTPISDYDKLHVFGCPAYYHVTNSKLDSRAKKAMYVNSRDVTFDKSGMFLQKIENNDEALKQVEKVVFSPDMVASTEEPIDQVDNNSDVLEQEEQSLINERVEEPESIAKNRPRRVIQKPARFDDMIAYAFSMIDGVPNNYKDAIQRSDSLHSQENMNQQINQIWDLVQLPRGKKKNGYKWVYEEKENSFWYRYGGLRWWQPTQLST